MLNYKEIITLENGKKGGKACIRGMRIKVADVLNMLANDQSMDEILESYDELTKEDILACLAYVSEKENSTLQLAI
jgi:uncharacterized protein (DUF433 family)